MKNQFCVDLICQTTARLVCAEMKKKPHINKESIDKENIEKSITDHEVKFSYVNKHLNTKMRDLHETEIK